LYAYKVDDKLGRKKSMAMVVMLISAGYFLAGQYISLSASGVKQKHSR
jgi:hypothetical protein